MTHFFCEYKWHNKKEQERVRIVSLFCDSWKAATIEKAIKTSNKELIIKIKQRGIKTITLQGAIDKSLKLEKIAFWYYKNYF